jgi:hypothetical protein
MLLRAYGAPPGACRRIWPMSLLLLVGIAAAGTLGACSSQQLYGASQAWQRNECFKIGDAQERSRCLASAATSYEQYRRDARAADPGR